MKRKKSIQNFSLGDADRENLHEAMVNLADHISRLEDSYDDNIAWLKLRLYDLEEKFDDLYMKLGKLMNDRRKTKVLSK